MGQDEVSGSGKTEATARIYQVSKGEGSGQGTGNNDGEKAIY